MLEKTLKVMPSILRYNWFPTGIAQAHLKPPCRRTSSSSDNSTQTSLADSKTQSTYDTDPTEELSSSNSHCCAIVDEVDETTPPSEAMRQTSSDSVTLDTSPSTKQASAIDLDHCRAIVQELQTPLCDVRTFNNVTPAEFALIQSFLLDQRDRHSRVKLFYISDLFQLLAMTPHPIHEIPIEFFADSCRSLLAPHHVPRLPLRFRFNYPIKSGTGTVIPDFHLDLEPEYELAQLPIPVWVMECGFSQTRAGMKHQLQKAAEMNSGIDAAFMVCIRESGFRLPEAGHPLFSSGGPALEYASFKPAAWPRPGTLPPVVVENLVWVDVRAVNVYLFLRGEDGRFNFKDGNPLATRGSLFPMQEMREINDMFDLASRRLLLRMADVMEQNHDNDNSRINRLRTASEDLTFSVEWPRLLERIQVSLYHTAWSRYLERLSGEEKARSNLIFKLEPSTPGPSILGDHTSGNKIKKSRKGPGGKSKRK